MPVAKIAENVGLSYNPCWRRIQSLEAAGVIRKRVTLLDGRALNADMTVFVSVRSSWHDAEWLRHLATTVAEIPEVIECYRMIGGIDYLLRVVVPNIAAYEGVYQQLIERFNLDDVTSSPAMEQIKYTTAVPLHYAR